MNDGFSAWYWLVEHKIFNVFSRTTVSGVSNALSKLLNTKDGSDRDIDSRTSYFDRGISINFVRCNPLNETIEKDESLNTLVQVWLECSTPIEDENGDIQLAHDWSLDVGAETFELALVKLVELIKETHGDDQIGSAVMQSVNLSG